MISQRTVAAVKCGIETGDLGKIGKSVEKYREARDCAADAAAPKRYIARAS